MDNKPAGEETKMVYICTRSFACVPVVAGTHAPGRGEGVEGLRGWSRDIITAFSCCRRWKGQKTMPSGGNVDDTYTPD